MEAIFPLILLVVGMGVAIWIVRTKHRPKTRIGRIEADMARFPAGTRAFESSMSLGILDDMLAARERQLAGALDADQRAIVEKQVANLRAQKVQHQAVVDARDLSRGKMSFGVDPDSDTID